MSILEIILDPRSSDGDSYRIITRDIRIVQIRVVLTKISFRIKNKTKMVNTFDFN